MPGITDDQRAALDRLEALECHLTMVHASAMAHGKEATMRIVVGETEVAAFDLPEFARDLVTLSNRVREDHPEIEE